MPERTSAFRISEREPFAYVEHAHIRQEHGRVGFERDGIATELPASRIAALLVGPGCTITSSATRELAYRQTTVVHVGEEGVRYVATGRPWSSDGQLAHRHAHLWATDLERTCRRLYKLRWGEPSTGRTPSAVRGEEGAAARRFYRDTARHHRIPWDGRRRTTNSTDPVNSALSWAGACVNALAAAAFHAAGAVPALGFLHSGGSFSFVYDIADLARNDVIELTFHLLATNPDASERDVRHACRDHFRANNVGERLVGSVVDLVGGN